MLKNLLIRNNSRKIFRVMLEPHTYCENVSPGEGVIVENVCHEDALQIDIGDEVLISIWSDTNSDLKMVK